MKKSKRPFWSIPPCPASEGFPEDALWLSPEQETIMQQLSAEEFRPAREIRKAAGMSRNRDFPVLMRNLVERNILVTDAEGRYRISAVRKKPARKRATPRKSA